MSRSGYTDDYDEDGTGGLWRGAVARSIRGKRGQAALKEIAEAMDAMPKKILAAESLVTGSGEFCTLGVLGNVRGLSMDKLDPEDCDAVAKAFNIAPAMVREIVFENDEAISRVHKWIEVCGPMRPQRPYYENHYRYVDDPISAEDMGARRWGYMRQWVSNQIIEAKP